MAETYDVVAKVISQKDTYLINGYGCGTRRTMIYPSVKCSSELLWPSKKGRLGVDLNNSLLSHYLM